MMRARAFAAGMTAVAACVAFAACGGGGAPAGPARSGTPATMGPGTVPALDAAAPPPSLPSVASAEGTPQAAAAGRGPRDWIAAVPPRALGPTVGDLVWGAYPAGDEVRVAPCRVLTVGPTSAKLEADDHSVHEGVSGALIHLVADPQGIKIGDVVTNYDWRRDLSLAVVTRRDPYMRLNAKFRDSLRVVREEPIHVAQPLPSEIAPLAWVMFPYPGAGANEDPRPMYRGLVFGVDGDRLFVRDDANRAWVVAKGTTKLLPVSAKPRREGDSVAAFEFGAGFRAGTIRTVFDPGYAYGVARSDEASVKSFFFDDLVDPL